MEIETKRLVLRQWKITDAEQLYNWAKDPQVGPIAGWPVHKSVEDSKEIIKTVLSKPETYAVVLKASMEVVGSVGIMRQGEGSAPIKEGEAEIGYWLAVPFWGQGLIPEAVKALQHRCFEELGCSAIWCGYFDENEKSKRVQEKCGFHYHHSEENKACAIANLLRTEHLTYLTKEEWLRMDNEAYKILDLNSYYRKGVYDHFTKDCKCSTSITARVDVTALYDYSKAKGTKFYINFLYLLTKVLNSRDDYKMVYRYQTQDLLVYNKINPIHYVFHKDTETCTPVYSEYFENYELFYKNITSDIEKVKQNRAYNLQYDAHPNWFDASYISWLSYDSLNLELPDGYFHFLPIINWGRFRIENDRKMMPLTIRLNHAVADGYHISKVYLLLDEAIKEFIAK